MEGSPGKGDFPRKAFTGSAPWVGPRLYSSQSCLTTPSVPPRKKQPLAHCDSRILVLLQFLAILA